MGFGLANTLALMGVVILANLPTIAADVRPSAPASYLLFQTIPVSRPSDGVDGFLQILQDDRITDDVREKMRGMDGNMYCYEASLAPSASQFVRNNCSRL
jgi:hypothetical protein